MIESEQTRRFGVRGDPTAPTSQELEEGQWLSPAQERIWIDQKLAPSSSSYNCAVLMRLRGPIETEALFAALRCIVERHAPLCSIILDTDAAPRWRRVAVPCDLVRSLDLRDTYDSSDDAVAKIAIPLVGEPFDLTRTLPVRVYFGSALDGSHVLALVVHHIAWDGGSTNVFFRELQRAYDDFCAAKPANLPPLILEYGGYIARKRELGGGENRERLITAARTYFSDMTEVGSLPADFKRIKLPDSRGERTSFSLNATAYETLRAMAQASGVTVFHLLLGLTASFIARQSGAEDIVIAVPVTDRRGSAEHALIGLLLDTIVVRLHIDEEMNCLEVAGHAREAFVAALDLQELPLGDVLSALAVTTGSISRPTINVLLTLDQMPARPPNVGEASISLIDIPAHSSRFDFGLSFVLKNGGLFARLEFASDLFSSRSVEVYTARLKRFIVAAITSPGVPVGDLPLLSYTEKRFMANYLQGPRHEAAIDPLAQVLEIRRTSPGMPAVTHGAAVIDYEDLIRRVSALATRLRRDGITRGDTIALIAERSPSAIIGILSAWYIGATVVPIDADWIGDDRFIAAIDACRASIILGTASLLTRCSPSGLRAIAVDQIEDRAIEDKAAENISAIVDQNAGAYIMFTTGSMGPPKPVLVHRRQLAETLAAACELLARKRGARVLWSASLTFDIAFLEIFLPLVTGGCSVLHGPTLDLTQLAKQMEAVDVFHAVPTVMEEMALLAERNHSRRRPTHPGVILVGGEAVSPKLLHWLQRLWPASAICVLYGLTEATIICSSRQLRRGAIPSLPVIGPPHRNVTFRIVQQRGTLAPVGVPGELWISGPIVVEGYLNAEISERFMNCRGSRWLRTGDRVRLTWDGDIEFLGRLDQQEKIRGVRVEPAVVENTMRDWAEFADVAVVGADLLQAGRALVAYGVRSGRGEIDMIDVRERLAREVSAAAIPRHLVWLDALPKNRNGKLDRTALAKMASNVDVVARTAGYELEQVLASLWRAVLGRAPVSPDDSFYALGGDSLAAMRLLAQIRRVFSVSPAIDEILLRPTLRGMVRSISGDPLPPTIATFVKADSAVPTVRQLELLRYCKSGAAYRVILRLAANIDAQALQTAVRNLVRRHDALRTRLTRDSSDMPRLFPTDAAYNLMVAECDDGEIEDDNEAYQALWRLRPETVDVPLCAVALRGQSRSYLAMWINMLIADRASINYLLCELASFYSSELEDGAPLQLEASPSFLAYADGEYASKGHPKMRAASDTWIRRLSSSNARPVRFTCRDGAKREMHCARLEIEGAGRAIGALSSAFQATEFAIALSLLAICVGRYVDNGFPRIAVRTSNRSRPGSERLVGPLANEFFVDINTSASRTFRQLVDITMENLGERYLIDGVPRDVVVTSWLESGRSFDTLDTRLLCGWDARMTEFSWAGMAATLVNVRRAAEEEALEAPTSFDLVIDLGRNRDDLVLEAMYNRHVLAPDHIDSIAQVLDHALNLALADGELSVAAIAKLLPTNAKIGET